MTREVSEYFTLEIWEHEDDGSLGWRLSSYEDGYDPLVVALMSQAVARQLREEEEGSDLAVSIDMYENGSVEADFQGGRDFTTRENYVLTQENMRLVLQSKVRGDEFQRTSKFWRVMWNLEWLYFKVKGKLKPQYGANAGFGAVTTTVPEHLLRAFDGLPIRYLEGTGKVIPLRPKEKSNA